MIGVCVELKVGLDTHKVWINSLYNQNSERFRHQNLSEEFKNSIQNNFTFCQEMCFDDERILKHCSRIHISLEYQGNKFLFFVRTYDSGKCSQRTSILITPDNKEYIIKLYDDIVSAIDEGYWKWDSECTMCMFDNAR